MNADSDSMHKLSNDIRTRSTVFALLLIDGRVLTSDTMSGSALLAKCRRVGVLVVCY